MRRTERCCYLVALLLLPLVFFWPNIRSGGVMLPLDILHHLEPFSNAVPPPLEKVHNPHISDLVTIYYPCVELFCSTGSFVPLWNPYSFCGSPVLANAQNGVLFPLSWLFRVIPVGPAYLIVALAKMWFCGLFAFLFYRKVGFHSLSALLGSIGFMFCGHMIVWFGYPTSFPLTAWPFLFWALEHLLGDAGWRNLAWVSIGFGLVFIGGQPQTGFLISVAAVLYTAVRSARPGKSSFRLWFCFAISGVLGLCLAAPQTLPFLEYLRRSAASVVRGIYGNYGWKHYPWFTLISWIMPRFFGDVRAGNFWGFSSFLGEAVYIGSIPLVFACLSLFDVKKWNNHLRATLAVFLFGCLGLYIKPLARLFLAVPLLSSIDNNKLMALVAFGLISFSVFGFDLLLAETADFRKLFIRWFWTAVAWMAFVALGFAYFANAIQDLDLQVFETREACWLVALLTVGGVVFWLLKSGRLSARAAASLILLATVGDLFRVWMYYYPSYPGTYLLPASDALTYLQKNAGNNRIIGLGDILPPETSVLYRLQDMRGYDGLTPYTHFRVLEKIDANVHDLWHKLQRSRPASGKWTFSTLFYRSLEGYLNSSDPQLIAALSRVDYWSNGISSLQRPSLLSILGVRFVLSPKGIAIPSEANLHLVYSSDADVWENEKVLPRAFIVTKPVLAESDEVALDIISAKDFPFESTAVVTIGRDATAYSASEDHGPGTLVPAEIQRYDAENVEIRASSAGGGWLILSDLFYPGWKATCDDTPVSIFSGNYLFRAVRIPPGSHLIRFAYNPLSFRLGLLLVLLAAAAVLSLILGDRAAKLH
jgi:hypothetical protein